MSVFCLFLGMLLAVVLPGYFIKTLLLTIFTTVAGMVLGVAIESATDTTTYHSVTLVPSGSGTDRLFQFLGCGFAIGVAIGVLLLFAWYW